MNRKDFLWKTGAALLAFTLPVKDNYAFDPSDQATGSCLPTTTDILGPYYRANAPFRSDLTVPGDPGAILTFKGRVLNEDCNPLSDAIVDVWQANDAAEYDQTSANFKYRGRFRTGATGEYEFKSIKPGWYLNGQDYRPAHIHFRVTRPGFTELVTQLYFQGDPYIAQDPWASHPDAQLRIVPINQINNEGVAAFDVTLKGPTDIKKIQKKSPVGLSPNPVRDTLNLRTSGVRILNVEILNTAGQLVATSYDLATSHHQIRLNFLGCGMYFCRVETEDGIFVHKLVKE